MKVKTTFRTDIQALRGLAILLVVLYHAKVGFPTAGYLGVDIFFVISGYLITQIVQRGVENGNFSFREFYFRRAKRLLPSAYITLLATALLSGVLLSSAELLDYTKQFIGAITFTGNIVLWRQSGYFEGAATLKPLLHVWSLAIEEQYYLLLPAAFVFIPKRFWLPGTVLLLIVSLALCLSMVTLRPGTVFYLLPTRGWELAIGSLGALTIAQSQAWARLSYLFWPALLTLLLFPFAPTAAPHPGLNAIIVCLATLVLILRQHPSLDENIATRYIAKVGDFSYSLYLVHWPLFAFANNVYITGAPTGVRLGLVALSFALGYLLFRYVELPIRQLEIRFTRRYVGAALAASLVLVAVALGVAQAYSPKINYSHILHANEGFGEDCDYKENFTPKAECRNSDKPRMLVWGDSLAKHLIPGIVATTDLGIVQATRNACGPFVGLAPIATGTYGRPWAEHCLQFNQSVLDYLATESSIEVVVLSGNFGTYLEGPKTVPGLHVLNIIDGKPVERERSTLLGIEAMSETVKKIRELGKRVIVVAPPPSANFNVGNCLEREARGKVILGLANADCDIPVSVYRQSQADVLAYLARLHGEAGVDVVRFDEVLCSSMSCATELDGTFIYRDSAHLSYDGSRLLAKRMGLSEQLYSIAK